MTRAALFRALALTRANPRTRATVPDAVDAIHDLTRAFGGPAPSPTR